MTPRIAAVSFLLLGLSAAAHSASQCKASALISGTVYQVSDSSLTASSHYGCPTTEGPARSRLDTKDEQGKAGAWCASQPNTDQWIQVDFEKHLLIKAVATQGRNLRAAEWVTSYQLEYNDGHGWKKYMENGQNKTFGGNSNQNTIRNNTLVVPFHARYIRLHPKTWNGWICLRWEIYGCEVECAKVPLLISSSENNSSYALEDCQLTASSYYQSWEARASRSRLDTRDEDGKVGGWCPATANIQEWIQVDFKQLVQVSSINTQGRYYTSNTWYQRVTAAYLLFSNDGYTWTTYVEGSNDKLLGTDTYTNNYYNQILANPFVARYVRLNPRTWRSYPCLRWELYGCLL